jgi:hypothetical protein
LCFKITHRSIDGQWMAGYTMKRKWNLPIYSGFASMIEDGSVNQLRAGQSHIAKKACSDSPRRRACSTAHSPAATPPLPRCRRQLIACSWPIHKATVVSDQCRTLEASVALAGSRDSRPPCPRPRQPRRPPPIGQQDVFDRAGSEGALWPLASLSSAPGTLAGWQIRGALLILHGIETIST